MNWRRIFHVLCGLHALVAIGVFVAFRGALHHDKEQYLFLADSLLKGTQYSFWGVLGSQAPADTLRGPGYPLFLLPFRLLSDSLVPILLVNLVIYGLAVWLCLKQIDRIQPSDRAKSLFLLVLLPNLQIVMYATTVFTEPLMVFLIVLELGLLSLGELTTGRAVAIGLLDAWLALIRPVYLLFPLARFGYEAVRQKLGRGLRLKSFTPQWIAIGVFALGLLPYGMWNLRHHGVFQVTPIEGKGMFYIGYWQLKLPGFREDRLYTNYMGDDITWPNRPDSFEAAKRELDSDWSKIDATCGPLLSDEDRRLLASMDEANSKTPYILFKTYNSRYTLERERMFKSLTLQRILETPGYYLISRLYTAVRLFVVGVSRRDLRAVHGIGSYVKLFAPPLITFVTFVLGGLLLAVQLFRGALPVRPLALPLGLVLYYWLIQVPFIFTSRYTIPIQMPLILLIALALDSLLSRKERGMSQGLVRQA